MNNIATIREALEHIANDKERDPVKHQTGVSGSPRYAHAWPSRKLAGDALAALTELEQQLASANRRIEVLEIMDMTATAQQWEMGMKHEKARAVAAETDRDRLADTLRWAIDQPNLGALIPDKQAYEWWKSQIAARAALDKVIGNE